MTQHTPGPWATIDGAEVFPTTGPTSHVELARIVGPWEGSTFYDKVTAKANARLIAAAPEILAWLQAAYNEAVERSEHDGDVAYWNDGGDGYNLTEGIRSLLAKIEGKE